MTTTCDVCDTTDRPLGAVCQHLVHGALLTYTTAPRKAGEIPDTACTGCDATHKCEGWSAAKESVSIHMVCDRCYAIVEKRNILATEREYDKGFALVSELQVAASEGRPPNQHRSLPERGFAKLGFSPIPSKHPLGAGLDPLW